MTQVSDGRGVRREGGPRRPGPCRAARAPHRPPGPALAVAGGEPALPPEAPSAHDEVHGRVRRGRAPGRGAGADRRRHGRLRERGRQGPGAGGRSRVQRVPGPERRRRGAGRLHEQPAVRGDARVRRATRRTSRWRACSTGSPKTSGSTAGRSAGGTPSTSGDRFGTGQVLGPGVGLKATLLAVRDAYRDGRYAGIACGVKNTGIGNGVPERGPGDPAARGRRHRHAVPLVDRDGPGRPHGAPPDRVRGARAHAPIASGSSSTPSASSTPGRRPRRVPPRSGGRAVIEAARELRAALRRTATARTSPGVSSRASSSSTGRQPRATARTSP